MKRNKDYLKGWKHGVNFTLVYLKVLEKHKELKVKNALKVAFKSLKEGR